MKIAGDHIGSQDSSVHTEHDRTEMTRLVTTSSTKKGRRSSSLRNNIAYFLLAVSVYFNENYFASIVTNFIPSDKVGITSSFLFIPMLLLKLFGLKIFTLIPIRLRIVFTGSGFFIASILALIFTKTERDLLNNSSLLNKLISKNIISSSDPLAISDYVKEQNFIIIILVNSLSAVSMAIGEVTVLENVNRFQRSCIGSFNTGHGASGLMAASISLILKEVIKKNKEINSKVFFVVSLVLSIIVFIAYFIILGKEKYGANGILIRNDNERDGGSSNGMNRDYISAGDKTPMRNRTQRSSKDSSTGSSPAGNDKHDNSHFEEKSHEKESNGANSKSKENIIENHNDKKKIRKIKQKYSILQMLQILYFGKTAYFAWTFFADYFLYFLIYSGVLTFAKDLIQIKNGGQKVIFFEKAFLCMRFFVFLCKISSYFVVFYKVAYFPLIHIFSLICLIITTKVNPIKELIFGASCFVGIAHGLAGAFVMVGIRKKIEERWVGFGLKYITVASSFGASFGCLAGMGMYKILERFIKI